jgi:uncharacterized protein
MVLIRLVVVFLIFYVIFAALRSLVRSKLRVSGKHASDPTGEEMVLDPQCRSYVPKSDAVAQSGRYFCSRECARQYLSS